MGLGLALDMTVSYSARHDRGMLCCLPFLSMVMCYAPAARCSFLSELFASCQAGGVLQHHAWCWCWATCRCTHGLLRAVLNRAHAAHVSARAQLQHWQCLCCLAVSAARAAGSSWSAAAVYTNTTAAAVGGTSTPRTLTLVKGDDFIARFFGVTAGEVGGARGLWEVSVCLHVGMADCLVIGPGFRCSQHSRSPDI